MTADRASSCCGRRGGAVLLHFTRFGANVYALGGSRTPRP